MHIRHAITQDLAQLADIEFLSFTDPWSLREMSEAMRQRNCTCRVAQVNKAIAGFVMYGLQKSSMHIIDLAVHTDYRMQGVGRALIGDLISRLRNGRTVIRFEVSELNLPAQLFLKNVGFRAVKMLHDYYRDAEKDCDESAIAFEYRIPEAEMSCL